MRVVTQFSKHCREEKLNEIPAKWLQIRESIKSLQKETNFAAYKTKEDFTLKLNRSLKLILTNVNVLNKTAIIGSGWSSKQRPL